MQLDRDKIETAIVHLSSYYSTVDNILYEHYSVEGLKKELDEIEASKMYLQSLLDEEEPCTE